MRHAFLIGGELSEVWLARDGDGYRMHVGEAAHRIALQSGEGGLHRLSFDGETHDVLIAVDGDQVHLHFAGASHLVRYVDPVARYASHHGPSADDVALAPMPGTVISVAATAGQTVARGDVLVVIESMKLETAIKAWRDGVVQAVHFDVGQSFERSAPLVTLEPES